MPKRLSPFGIYIICFSIAYIVIEVIKHQAHPIDDNSPWEQGRTSLPRLAALLADAASSAIFLVIPLLVSGAIVFFVRGFTTSKGMNYAGLVMAIIYTILVFLMWQAQK